MDGGSWMLQAAAGDLHGGDSVRCSSWGDVIGQEAMMLSSQAMQQQLSQIYMLMDMEEQDQYAIVAPAAPSPSSSSFRSFSAATSRDDNSSLMLTGAATSTNTAASCHQHHHQQPEVSSQIPPLSAYGAGVDVPNPESIRHQETHPAQARRSSRSGGHGAAASAFRSYSRYFGLERNLLRPAGTAGGGQRAFKKAISVLSKIHTARIAQYYQIMEMAAAQARSSPATGSSCDNNQQLQLQHVMSERKRREKLNDSFKALRDVLPPATKKDKASILMRAKDYVSVLKARITELEEKNRMLSESQLHPGEGEGDGDGDGDGEKDDDKPDDKIEVDIGRSAAVDGIPHELHLKIVLGSSSGCSAMDAMAGILQGLNEKRDVSLLAKGNASSSGRLPRAKSSQQPAAQVQQLRR